jgi:hypothetical protein
VSLGIADNWSPLRRSATDRDSDQESDNERNAETRRVDEWNEARSSLGDLERPDRAGAHAGAAATSAPLGLGVLAPARSATCPKTIAHTGYRNYRPSADIDWVTIDVSHARADLEVIA